MAENQVLAPIPGFPELSPGQQIVWQAMMDTIRTGFERFGFGPIETPAVERNDVLTAKQGEATTKEIYQLTRLMADPSEVKDRDFSLHFDLTVPFARYTATHYQDLTFPFRRYQIQPVWRGEKPSKRQGRYRQFYQCDIDVIGDGVLSLSYDAEIPAVINHIFSDLNMGAFVIRLNNSRILGGFLRHLGLEGASIPTAMRIVDKLEKQGAEAVIAELSSTGMSGETAASLIDFVSFTGSHNDVLSFLRDKGELNEDFHRGTQELGTVLRYSADFDIPEDRLVVDLGIARGLSYYTGTVYETTLVDHPELGSVCSGGRYDELAEHFTDRHLPGVGISIGLTRLFYGLLEAEKITTSGTTVAPVFVATPLHEGLRGYIALATEIRAHGIGAEIFLESARGLGKQLKYAGRRGFSVAVIVHEQEVRDQTVTLKNLLSQEQTTVVRSDMLTEIDRILGR